MGGFKLTSYIRDPFPFSIARMLDKSINKQSIKIFFAMAAE